jgi:hypothetical protein
MNEDDIIEDDAGDLDLPHDLDKKGKDVLDDEPESLDELADEEEEDEEPFDDVNPI